MLLSYGQFCVCVCIYIFFFFQMVFNRTVTLKEDAGKI